MLFGPSPRGRIVNAEQTGGLLGMQPFRRIGARLITGRSRRIVGRRGRRYGLVKLAAEAMYRVHRIEKHSLDAQQLGLLRDTVHLPVTFDTNLAKAPPS